MKNYIVKFSLAASLTYTLFAFTGCNLVDKATDISFTTNLEDIFQVDESTTTENKVYETSLTLDASTNSQINTHQSRVKSFEVNKITYEIENYSGPEGIEVTMSDVSVSFGNSDGTPATVLATIDNLNLYASSNAATKYELDLNQTDLDKIATLLKNDKAVKIYLKGTLSQTPVSFEVTLALDIKVIVNPF